MNEPAVMTVQEVAAFLRVQRVTIYRLIKRGEIPAFKIGSDYRFLLSSVEKWMGEKRVA